MDYFEVQDIEAKISRRMEILLEGRAMLLDNLSNKIGFVENEYGEPLDIGVYEINKMINSYPEIFGKYDDVVFLKSFERNFWAERVLSYYSENGSDIIPFIEVFNKSVRENLLLQTFGLVTSEICDPQSDELIDRSKPQGNDKDSWNVFQLVKSTLKRLVFIYPELFSYQKDALKVRIENKLKTEIGVLSDKIENTELTDLEKYKRIEEFISAKNINYYVFLFHLATIELEKKSSELQN